MDDLTKLLLSSPVGPLLEDRTVTDITYNGGQLYYLSSHNGRIKYGDFNAQEALNLVRQIANLTNQLFTYQNPILDVVFSCYRFSAVHPLITREREQGVVSFAIRVANQDKELLVRTGMIDEEIKRIIDTLLVTKKSIILSGLTGVGKTEVQKYIIGRLQTNARIIIIDQGIELAITQSLYPHLDITMWRYDDRLIESSLASLLKTSLRFNPDYLVIAEARGKEIIDIYNASLSGHASFFTMHSEGVTTIYQRMLAMGNYQSGITIHDLVKAFPYVIQMDKTVKNNAIVRKITKIVSFVNGYDNPTYLYSNEQENT